MAEERPPGAIEDAVVESTREEIVRDDDTKRSDHSGMAGSDLAGSVNEDPSMELAADVEQPNATSISAEDGNTSIGMFRVQSPWLHKQGVYIAMFQENSVLTFVGGVQLRVLAGLIHCFGYIFKPSTTWHELFIPTSLKQPALSLSAVKPTLMDQEFAAHLEPFRSQKGVHFHAASLQEESQCSDEEGCIAIDLEYSDVQQLNQLAKGEWQKMVAIVQLKSLTAPFSRLLTSESFFPSAFRVVPNCLLISGFQLVQHSSSIKLPNFYRKISWDLAQLSGVVLLVCGAVGLGKSTLCRYLVNYFLNRWPLICYVESDVGQTEFTVPGVLALHMLSEPVLGPPMAHLRTPTKAYYFGASTPANNPEYYYRGLKGLQQYLAEVVRPAHPNIPVIINTCGWVKDMGFSLLLDIIRTFSPTHIVQLVDSKHAFHLTPTLLTYFSGMYTRPKAGGDVALTTNCAAAQEEASQRQPVAVNGEAAALEEGEKESMETTGTTQVEGSDDEGEMNDDNRSQLVCLSSESDEDNISSDDDVLLMATGRHHHCRVRAPSSMDTWVPLLSHQLFKTDRRHVQIMQNSSIKIFHRRLVLLSYFSPLLGQAEAVAKEQDLAAETCANFMFFAPPLEIPWADVALHVVHSQVPRSQILYALNGQVVALGQVHTKEIVSCNINSPGVGVVKFLKSTDPLIEFIGLGLVRAIDTVQQRYYVTTPLSLTPELLERVNVLAIGQTDMLLCAATNTVSPIKSPYCH